MTFRALAVATNTFIRINEQGMLCVQHTIEHAELEKESVLAFVMFPRASGLDGGGGNRGGNGDVDASARSSDDDNDDNDGDDGRGGRRGGGSGGADSDEDD